MLSPKLVLGTIFVTAQDFRDLVREVAIRKGYDLFFIKNDGDRITVRCRDNCGWKVHASYVKEKEKFQLKTLRHPKHSCSRLRKNDQAKAGWLAKKYIDRFRDDPNWSLEAFQNTIARELILNVSKHKLYRAKKRALLEIKGDHDLKFNKLWDYCNPIRTKNPGSVVQMKVESTHPNQPAHFMRLFITYHAMITGFLGGCRPFIGLDGCHLKGSVGGQMLSAVARDGNNGIFPVAIAVVEAETKETWTWFMSNLLQAIGGLEEHGCTFISDRQKGLVATFDELLPRADHRFCVRHMYANFKGIYKERIFKDEIWMAATSYTVHEFEQHMEKIKSLDQGAHNWLRTTPASLWSRSHFSTRSKCEMLCNNPSESWNKCILKARDKPIITMLEMIRKMLMSRIQAKRIQPGRPRKAKRWTADEPEKRTKVRRYGISLRCSNCKQYGHNISTCKNPHVEVVERSCRGGRPPLNVGCMGASGRARGRGRMNPYWVRFQWKGGRLREEVPLKEGSLWAEVPLEGVLLWEEGPLEGGGLWEGGRGKGKTGGIGATTGGMSATTGGMGATARRGLSAEMGAVVWAAAMGGATPSNAMVAARGKVSERSACGTQNVHTIKWFGSSSQGEVLVHLIPSKLCNLPLLDLQLNLHMNDTKNAQASSRFQSVRIEGVGIGDHQLFMIITWILLALLAEATSMGNNDDFSDGYLHETMM
ncbi:hypothetical protein L1049_023648 [Liquidambar formosana]|uniref:Transposase n=1 Tax=Liquidambar formosana TaxID=63359 RepID=A0AAP0RTE2_LIQFO